ncbi:DUF4267 domain-containing protein [Promicromonospora sp. NPDC019610]|uniref:DUF4267 domain-containing protein n=1 Tax=Promicromonospora sp. NPDC019610 TaxID=3364405 RepID=UPI0037949F48
MTGVLAVVATILAGPIGVAIVLLGANGLRAPQAAVGFGIPGTPADDPAFQSWLAVKAVRDLACGVAVLVLVLAVLLSAVPSHLLGWYLVITAGIPVGDALIVLRSGGPRAVAYGVHAATAAVLVLVGVVLLVA